MDKREFIQRFMIENYEMTGTTEDKINRANLVFDKIEEVFAKPVNPTNLWDYNDK